MQNHNNSTYIRLNCKAIISISLPRTACHPFVQPQVETCARDKFANPRVFSYRLLAELTSRLNHEFRNYHKQFISPGGTVIAT
jgi:hypothetical protein